MKRHILKVLPEFFTPLAKGVKNFEVRLNDRNYQVGDELLLREFQGDYTGSIILRRIQYILPGGQFGIEEGYVVLALKKI